MIDKKIIGKRIREERKAHNYTIEKFATMIDVGDSFLGQIERGEKMPSLNTFVKITNCLGDISSDKILRDYVIPGIPYVLNDITIKMKTLPPDKVKLINDLVDAVIMNCENSEECED